MTSSLHWSQLPPEHNLAKFAAELPAILENVGYKEMFGVELAVSSAESKTPPHSTLVILQKFLRANTNDLAAARTQLTEALKWRKEYNPLAVKDEVFSADKFGGLGYVATIEGAKNTPNERDVAIFNIYGVAAKDPKKTFGDTDAFVRWRVALMELTLAELHLDTADRPIPDYGQGPDPYQAIQVHDYLSVSFFRQPAEIKASSSKIIDLFQRYYPETVSHKYFINVPLIMQWMMGAMKALLSKDSIQKMTWLTYGNQLATYVGADVPEVYGGKSKPLSETGTQTKFPGSGVSGEDVAGADAAPAAAATDSAAPAASAGTA